ncbi:MAG: HD domain-containing protein [candidate division SR1 bacterium]|nr:HD domain-containing protein [candidate division SR1 bacterium]
MLYKDLIYGDFEIEEPVIIDLINSSAMQRLKGISQTGYTEPYFPNGDHSRFEHSLGVYLLLKKYGASIEEQIAGLLHDISHGTFSHCLDYVFDEGDYKQEHQDNIFETFIKKTDIPNILQKYGLDIDYIIDDSHFPLKETVLPDLCADRIDYSLRTAFHYTTHSSKEISALLEHLIIQDKKWIFTDLEFAKKYAELFYKMNSSYYSGIESAAMHQTVGDCLRYALKKGYLHADEFYTTDQQVLEKITAHIESDKQLNIYWQGMNNTFPYKNDPNDFDYHLFCKSRIVDPLFMDGKDMKRLSEVDAERKVILEREMRPKKYFLRFEK